jgi:hypothetical protein
VTGRRRRRRQQLLDRLKEARTYWKLKAEALHRAGWRTRFGRGYGPVVRQTASECESYNTGLTSIKFGRNITSRYNPEFRHLQFSKYTLYGYVA